MIDAKRRAEIRERCANATKAPWSVVGQPWGDSTCVYTGTGDPHGQLLLCDTSEREWNSTDQNAVADAHFIAHARQDVPDLLAALEAAEQRIEMFEQQIQEWINEGVSRADMAAFLKEQGRGGTP
ncbi:MAG: hypothetical protein KGL39_05720 [Patescibacteria group bacterium]|nr:hypothetical protein [Patescibacteria group bacterium]